MDTEQGATGGAGGAGRNGAAPAARALLERLARLEIAEGVAHEQVTVFPVFGGGDAHAPLAYRTLQEAIADGSVRVTERPGGASVPELVLDNAGPALILVLDGEEIVGGLQNRIVNASFLVPAETTFPLPVTCVEQGRWHRSAEVFASGEASPHRLRVAKHAQVTASLRARGTTASDQGAVWRSVAETSAALGASSPSGAMHDVYRSRDHDLAAYERALPYVAGAIGLIVALNGQVVGADVFDQPRTAEALWPKLVRSYTLDALSGAPDAPAERERAAQLLERARAARGEVFPSPGLGEDVRLEGDGVIGGGLVYEDIPIHIGLFRGDGREPGLASGQMARASRRRSLRLDATASSQVSGTPAQRAPAPAPSDESPDE